MILKEAITISIHKMSLKMTLLKLQPYLPDGRWTMGQTAPVILLFLDQMGYALQQHYKFANILQI